MHLRTILTLWAVAAALGLSCCEGFANPVSHPNPKSHPPSHQKGNTNANAKSHNTNKDHANAKSLTPGNKGTNPSATTNHSPHGQHLEIAKTEQHVEKQIRREERQLRELERLERKEAELAHLLRQQERFALYHQNPNGQQGNGRQPFGGSGGQQSGGQQFGGQQSGGQGGGSPGGGSGSGPSDVAQDSPSSGDGQGSEVASNGIQGAEKLLMAAIHQLEELLGRKEMHHRHNYQTAEAQQLDEAARKLEVALTAMRVQEEPRIEAEHRPNRS